MCQVIGKTRDGVGNEKRWTMDALPRCCDDAMTVRRLRRRHFVYFGHAATEVEWHWNYCKGRD